MIEEIAKIVTDTFIESIKLVPHLEKLKETRDALKDDISYTESSSIIIFAQNGNPEKKIFDLSLKLKRVEALIVLVETLVNTEIERIEFKDKEDKSSEVLKLFGL